MNGQDWERFGDEIRRTVQNAVETQDYTRLNQTITNTLNQALNGAAQSIRNFGESMERPGRSTDWNRADGAANNYNAGNNYNGGNAYGAGNAYRAGNSYGAGNAYGAGNSYRAGNAYGAGNSYRAGNTYRAGSVNGTDNSQRTGESRTAGQYAYGQNGTGTQSYRAKMQTPVLFESVTTAKVGGVVLAVLGYGMGGALLLAFIIVLIVAVSMGSFEMGFQITEVTLGLLTAGCAVMAWQGTAILGRIKRFRAYVRTLNGREYCDVKELNGQVRKPLKFIVKDLENMIGRGWFRQGHLDQRKSCLIVSNRAYGQYLQLEEQMKQKAEQEKLEELKRQEEQKKQEKNGNKKEALSPEVQRIIEQGDAYIRRIRECNDAIPGEEISAKISRMELLVDRIFDRVEQNPESVADIRRLMEYYLPTTVKLLEAYEELDAQPVGGENIQTAKREIEATLDTLNTAFEKLLDDLFQDTAWDVSSDISVLHTMLAQEGLTENEIPIMK